MKRTRAFWAGAGVLAALAVAFIFRNAFPKPSEGAQVRLLPAPAVANPEPSTTPPERRVAATRTARAAAPASSPRSGIASFGAQKDMWAFAKEAEASPDVGFKFEGYSAARECMGFINMEDQFHEKVDQTLRSGNQQLYFAFQNLSARCAGFVSAGPSESSKLRQRLKDQIASSSSPLGALTRNGELGGAETLAAVRSGSPAALELVLPSLHAQYRAAILALCDLGKACGVDSDASELRCLLSEVCGQELWADAPEAFGPEWPDVQAEKERIVQAVKSGHFEGEGVPRLRRLGKQ